MFAPKNIAGHPLDHVHLFTLNRVFLQGHSKSAAPAWSIQTIYMWNSSSDMRCHLHLRFKSMVQIIISKVQFFFFLFCFAELTWWSLAQFYGQNVLSLGYYNVAISKNNVGFKNSTKKINVSWCKSVKLERFLWFVLLMLLQVASFPVRWLALSSSRSFLMSRTINICFSWKSCFLRGLFFSVLSHTLFCLQLYFRLMNHCVF